MPPALPAALQAQLDALTPAQQRALTTGAAAIAGVAVGYGLYRLATRLPRAGPYPPSSLPEGAFDVAIVGAGPAGAAAAFYAARGGARVVLIDRAKFPRDKVCGDTVCAPALPILQEMGVLHPLTASNELRPLATAGLVSPAGVSYVGRLPPPPAASGGAVVRRAVLDARLVQAAREAGASVREGCDVDPAGVAFDAAAGLWSLPAVKSRAAPLRARLLILADGATSRLATALGLVTEPPRGVAARVAVRGAAPPADALRVYLRDALPGFCGLARRPDGEVTFKCVLLPTGRWGGGCGRAAEADLARLTDAALKTPFVAAALGSKPKLGKRDDAPLRVGGQGVARVAAAHVLVVGDAAGAADPLTGAGVHAALAGGRIAGREAAAMVERGDFSVRATRRYAAAAAAVTSTHASSRRRAAAITRAPFLLDAAAAEVRRGGDAALARWAGVAGGAVCPLRPDVAVPYAVAAAAAAVRGGGGRVGGWGGWGRCRRASEAGGGATRLTLCVRRVRRVEGER